MALDSPIVGKVLSVNVGAVRPTTAKGGTTGIDKVPVARPVAVSDPGPGRSGLVGDAICDTEHHGGSSQAVYAVERSELDWWATKLAKPLTNGTFGENLTVDGIDTTGAVLGEIWRIGPDLVCAVTTPRIPCSTFAVWMESKGFLKAFTKRARPGTYLRVLVPGEVSGGDTVVVEQRPDHGVTIGLAFRALTLEPTLLRSLLDAGEHLDPQLRELALTRPR